MVDPKTVPSLTLNNGHTIPVLGLGTWQSEPDGSVYRAVRAAIEAGYRHLDCAYAYENEAEIGRAIEDAVKEDGITRSSLFITSKIWLTHYRRDRVPICARSSLTSLRLDYLDLLLLHFPFSLAQQDDDPCPMDSTGKAIGGDVDFLEAYSALEDLVDQGLVRSIGVSNFTVDQLKRLLAACRIKPVVNQIESHPYLVQSELKQFCDKNQIVVTAYSPLGNPGSENKGPDQDRLLKDPVVNRLAKKYHKSPGQILIKFQVARGNVVIPKSVHRERIFENIQVFDFELEAEEVKELESLDRGYRTCCFEMTSHLEEYPF